MGFDFGSAFGLGEEDGGERFSTGPNPVTVDNEWCKFEFGFTATSVSIRSDDAVRVSFDRPYGMPNRHIHLGADELPFSLGGETPVGSDVVWMRRADDASTDPGVEIIALG
jgi:hypothetical protein